MKKIATILLAAFSLFILNGCQSATPQEYFGQAVLNCNLLYGFAGNGMQNELAQPSEKLIDTKTMATAPMKRMEVIDNKLENLQSNFKNVKSLKSTEETKNMLTASIALYEYTLPVFRNEYKQLAALYDNNEPAEKIANLEKTISDTYGAKFLELYNAVWTAGKEYAAKNGMKVQEVNTSPSY